VATEVSADPDELITVQECAAVTTCRLRVVARVEVGDAPPGRSVRQMGIDAVGSVSVSGHDHSHSNYAGPSF
jgi:hypothetical protein